ERAKLGYFWRHAYGFARSGPNAGCLINAETGKPVIVDDERLTLADFKQVKLSETIESRSDKPCHAFHSALWQADPEKIHRTAYAALVRLRDLRRDSPACWRYSPGKRTRHSRVLHGQNRWLDRDPAR